jgi:Rhodopirellula transposase DDE domain
MRRAGKTAGPVATLLAPPQHSPAPLFLRPSLSPLPTAAVSVAWFARRASGDRERNAPRGRDCGPVSTSDRLDAGNGSAARLATPIILMALSVFASKIVFEHRLFSEISKNWAAEPLDSYEKMLKFIRTTSTQTGLVVGLKPDPRLISSLHLRPSKLLPRWNYTIAPNL